MPMRDRSSHHSASITSPTSAQISASTCQALQPLVWKKRMPPKPSPPSGPTGPDGVSMRQLKLKKTRRTISAKAVVATTSIRPLTRKAGKPTATATAAASSAATGSAAKIDQPAIAVSMPAP
nr:hypothetical protein [Aquincola sp. J276]